MQYGSLLVYGPLTQTATSALQVASGTTAQRPTGANGKIRYNTDNNRIEGYINGSWANLGAGDGSVTSVAVTGSTGLSVSGSPITNSGTISLTLGAELQALSGLSATGMLVRTGSATYANRSVAASSAAGAQGITVSNGDGVSGNPTVGFSISGLTASSGVSSTDLFVTFDGTNNTKATVAQLATQLNNNFVQLSGSTMTGALILNADPSAALGAATKQYVDNLVQGLSWKAVVRAATTANGTLATAFANGQVIDGVTLATGDRILLKNQTTQSENGIYTVNASGAPTRALDMNAWAEVVNAAVFVSEGTTNADVAFVCTSNAGGTLGSTAITFVQFSSAGSYSAGSGLTLTGTTFSVNTSGTTTGIVSGNVIVRSTATTGQVMLSSGTAGNEATWGAVNLASTNAVTGTLAVTNGGTGTTTSTGTGSVVLSASPTFTGTPASTTAAVDTNTTQIATTAFVLGQASATTPIVDGTAAVGTSTRYARADHVHPTDTSRAPLASPTFTGTPAAPTAAVDTNTTQIATTAYVVGQGYLKSSTAASTYVALAGSTMTGALVLNADPSAALGAATKQYVDNLLNGISWKNVVRVATTTAGTLATSFANGQTVDGVTLATGDRILIKDQTTASQNGIYVVAASGAPTRAVDADSWNELVNAAVFVSQGTVNADKAFVSTVDAGGTLGTTGVTFVQFSSAGAYTAGNGLTLTGGAFSVNTSGTTTGISGSNVVVRSTATTGQVMLSSGTAGNEATWGAVDLTSSNAVTGALPVANGGTGSTTAAGARTNLGVPGIYRTSFTNATLSAGILTVTHNLGQKFVSVNVYDNNDKLIQPDDITMTSTTVSTVDLTSFGTLTGTYNVVVIG